MITRGRLAARLGTEHWKNRPPPSALQLHRSHERERGAQGTSKERGRDHVLRVWLP